MCMCVLNGVIYCYEKCRKDTIDIYGVFIHKKILLANKYPMAWYPLLMATSQRSIDRDIEVRCQYKKEKMMVP